MKRGPGIKEPYPGLRRIPFTQHCRLEARGLVRDGLLCNISAIGVYVSFEPVPAVGESLHLSFQLPGDSVSIGVDAVCTWRNTREDRKVPKLPAGCGMRFLTLRPQDRDRIRSFAKSSARALVGGTARV